MKGGHAIEAVETVWQGWGRMLLATVRFPDGSRAPRQMEDHGGATCVLPYDPDRKVALLVRQFRTPVFHVSGAPDLLEAPAGIVEGEPAESARREVEEETGATLRELEHVVSGWSMPGISTERMDFYLAAYSASDRTGAGGGLASEHENVAVEETSLAELAAMADSGRLPDVKTMLLVQTLRLRRPELFA